MPQLGGLIGGTVLSVLDPKDERVLGVLFAGLFFQGLGFLMACVLHKKSTLRDLIRIYRLAQDVFRWTLYYKDISGWSFIKRTGQCCIYRLWAPRVYGCRPDPARRACSSSVRFVTAHLSLTFIHIVVVCQILA